MSYYASTPGLFPMQGGCPCGQIRFQLQLPPIIVHCCHCTACQLQQGSAFALNAVIESDNLTLLAPRSPPAISNPSGGPAIPTAAHAAIAGLVNAKVPPNLKQEGGSQATSPEIITVPTSSGAGQHIACCPSCRAGLWSYYADAGPHMSYVRVGALDRALEIDPDVHIYTKSQRRSIFTIADRKPQFEEYYPDRAAFYRDDVKDRVKAMEPKLKEWKEDMRKAFRA